MPFYLKNRNFSSDISNVSSVLIVPCRFCPAASIAVKEKKPYIKFFSSFLKTPSYETYVQQIKKELEQKGIKAAIFDSNLPQHFIVCMWTKRRRNALIKKSKNYDAVLVLGCDAAVKTVETSLLSASSKVISGMEVEGIMNVIPLVRFPCNISLEVSSIIPIQALKSVMI